MELILLLRRCSFAAFLATLQHKKLKIRMHSSRMRTARSSSRPEGGGGVGGVWEGETEFLTHACENITLPQTSFAAVTRKHSSRMRTAHFSGFGREGGLPNPPVGRLPWRPTPIWRQTPRERPPVNRITDTRKKHYPAPSFVCVRNCHSSLPLNPTGSKLVADMTGFQVRKKT